MSRTPQSESSEALVLRTAAVWGTFVLASRDLRSGQSLRMGEDGEALFAKPDHSPVADLPIRAVGKGWELDAQGATGGSLHLRGRQEDPCELGKRAAPVPIVAGDYGVLQYGSLSIFFQFAHPAPAPRSRFTLDPALVLSFVFALLTIGGSLMLLYMLFPQLELAKPLELTSPEELRVQYHFTPPPPDDPTPGLEAEGAAGAKSKAPEKAAGSSQRPPGPNRPSSEPPAADDSDGPQGLSAMTDVMRGAIGKEVMETLGTLSSVSEALGGLSSAGLVLGGRSGGVGLRASGAGGGQEGTAVFGSGTLDTGFGTGAGVAGNGRGRVGRGAGSDGDGTGRGGERHLAGTAVSASGQGLSPDQIARVVRARAGAFRACYESAAARDPRLQGGMTVSFSISPAGGVTARIASSSLASARVESCVLRMFNRLRFPSADKPTSANWPLVFRPGKQ
jgi:hypothetical protein